MKWTDLKLQIIELYDQTVEYENLVLFLIVSGSGFLNFLKPVIVNADQASRNCCKSSGISRDNMPCSSKLPPLLLRMLPEEISRKIFIRRQALLSCLVTEIGSSILQFHSKPRNQITRGSSLYISFQSTSITVIRSFV